MSITITLSDKVINKCKQVITENTDLESFVIEAVSNYIDEIKERKNDPFFKYLKKIDLKNNEGLNDISENHDKYLY